jgi:hypothetical protein
MGLNVIASEAKQSRFIEDQYVVRSLRRFTPRDDAFLKINQRFHKFTMHNFNPLDYKFPPVTPRRCYRGSLP